MHPTGPETEVVESVAMRRRYRCTGRYPYWPVYQAASWPLDPCV